LVMHLVYIKVCNFYKQYIVQSPNYDLLKQELKNI
jgi:hypothetical protein